MKDASFRMTRNREGKSTGYSDNDRGGLGSSAQKFEPIFVEYSAPSGYAKNPYAKKPEPKPGMLYFLFLRWRIISVKTIGHKMDFMGSCIEKILFSRVNSSLQNQRRNGKETINIEKSN